MVKMKWKSNCDEIFLTLCDEADFSLETTINSLFTQTTLANLNLTTLSLYKKLLWSRGGGRVLWFTPRYVHVTCNDKLVFVLQLQRNIFLTEVSFERQ